MNTIFQIEKLGCAYHPGRPVLNIPRLHIPQGQLVFVVGRSGVGKSTFIETLGLMNRTIEPSEATVVHFNHGSDQGVDLKNHWKLKNEELSAFRRKHFSFIFQNTNLMPNFSSGENMMVSLLLKGHDHASAREEVLKMMDRLELPQRVFDAPVSAISGGQRQRLAFVRAVTADFSVLFGDEPTGNLDPVTAHNLMNTLRSILHEHKRTGIVVSHDLSMALSFADMIVPLRRVVAPDGADVGEAHDDTALFRNEDRWTNAGGKLLDNPVNDLEQLLL